MPDCDLAQPGHYCAAGTPRWFMHEHAGHYCVSTIGQVRLPHSSVAEVLPSGDRYETAVFDLRPDRPRWEAVEVIAAPSQAEAVENHAGAVRKYTHKSKKASLLND